MYSELIQTPKELITMKNYILMLSLISAPMFIAHHANAQADIPNEPNYKLIVKVNSLAEGLFLELRMANLLEEKTNISILGSKGETVYRETVRNENGYNKKLNLKELEDGDYSLLVIQEGVEIIQDFNILNGKMALLTGSKTYTSVSGSGIAGFER